MKKILLQAALLLPLTVTAVERQLIDDGWQFSLDGSDRWERVDLPHDWSVTFDFDSVAPAGNDGGYLRTGKGAYRKTLDMTAADLSKNHSLYIEGAYMNSTLIVNGDTIGFRPYGYSSMIYDITPALKEGENLVEITVDNSQQKNCRWYSGSGIYRHVWLLSSGKTFVEPWSVAVTTADVSPLSADVTVCGVVRNGMGSTAVVAIVSDGKTVASRPVTVGDDGAFSVSVPIAGPALWSPESPSLYQAEIEIVGKDGKVLDAATETFGVRKFEYSAEKGLMLNGCPIVLNGGCVHHDNGILGARSYDDAEARKVRLMKEAGFNAVRTSHNPPSPAFLDECDRQGLIVIDEIFDGWRDMKTPHDYSKDFDAWWQRDVEAMVLRDRNHPSIMCWSIGNEVIERKKIEVVTTARKLGDLCRSIDPTRPVTSALASWDSDWEIYDPLASQHEIVGYNYMIHRAESDHERVPSRVMWQTESYPRDAFSNYKMVADHPYIIGDFVWTAIDYLGESGIGRFYYKGDSEGEHFHRDQWPWHGAYCGDIDLTGWRKPISYYRQALYDSVPSIHLAVREPDGYYGEIRETMWGVYPTWESWNWPGMEGKTVDVEVVSRHPRVALYLNGKEVGTAAMSRDNGYRAVFPVAYSPGQLRAVALDADGRRIGEEAVVNTAGKPVAIRLTADRRAVAPNNQDLVYVVAELLDRDGNVVPDADTAIDFSISGPGAVIATGSANLKDTASYCDTSRTTWKGRALAVVKSSTRPGTITLTARAPGLRKSSVAIKAK